MHEITGFQPIRRIQNLMLVAIHELCVGEYLEGKGYFRTITFLQWLTGTR
jgi:hypothetical protein